jgi:hypothetical protein
MSSEGTQVTWTAKGWVGADMNAFGMVGSWYAYDDCKDAGAAGLPCSMRDPSLMGPEATPTPGWAVEGEGATSKVCARGTASKVADDNSYAKQWGFGIGLDFNSPSGTKGKFNANGVTPPIKGFSFVITGALPAKLRINVPTSDPDNATYFYTVSLPATGPQKVLFSDPAFAQGSWIKMQTPELVKTFDPTSIYGVQFHVFTEKAKETQFDFCVSDFRVLQ